jgi:hypothetical protein
LQLNEYGGYPVEAVHDAVKIVRKIFLKISGCC